jgi:hypothetical protein
MPKTWVESFQNKSETFNFFFQNALSSQKMTLEGSSWAQNVLTNQHQYSTKRHDSTDVSVQSVAHAPHCTWKS